MSRRCRRTFDTNGLRRRLVVAVTVSAATLAIAGSTPGDAGTDPASTVANGPSTRATGELTLIDQTFDVAQDSSFDITLAVPLAVDVADFDARSVLVITSHRAITDRREFKESVEGDLKGIEDSFDVSLDPLQADLNRLGVTESTISIRVPTESVTRTPEALQMSQSGVHAVVIELRIDGRPAGDVTTYVNRLPSVPSTAGPLAVSIVARQVSLPVIGDDGSVTLSNTARAELTQLADTLASLDAAAAIAGTPVPRGVQVEPSLLQAVADTEPELASSLLPGLAAGDVIAAPRLPLDPSSAAAAGQEARYGDWLREGEDILGAILPNTAIDRTVIMVDDRTSAAAVAMQRNLGARLVVLPWDFYTDLEGNLGMVTDISQLLTIELADGQPVPAAVVDDFIGMQMVRGAEEPLLTAVEIAAELVVLARDLDIDGEVVERHGVVLALPDLGVPDAAFMAELAPLLATSPALRLVTPSQLETSTTTLLNDGRLVTLSLPDSAGPDMTARLALLDEVSGDVLAYASILPDDAPDIARWTATLEALPSTALTDEQADAAIARLNADFAAYRTAVVAPEPFAFTLTGRQSELPFSIGNTSDQTIRVRVNLSSPKIRFPAGDQIVEIAPRSETDVVIEVEALSNGKSSVFLRVYAPAENRTVQLAPEVVLTARVSSFAGLGQLITGAGLLLVMSWWAHHARSNRRKALAARHQARHPTGHREVASPQTADAADAAGAALTDEVVEISPDAAASSLPPS